MDLASPAVSGTSVYANGLKRAYTTIVYIRTVVYNAETVSNLTHSYLYIIHVQYKDRRLHSML